MDARQREVLDLLARGHTNPQIAERLGISLDGAKWHVSEVITRLGVDTREEAADYWRRRERAAAAAVSDGAGDVAGRPWGRVAFASLAVAAIGAGAALAILSLRGEENPAQADATPPATVATSPQSTAVTTPAVSPSASPTPRCHRRRHRPAAHARRTGGAAVRHLAVVLRGGLCDGWRWWWRYSSSSAPSCGQLVDTPPPTAGANWDALLRARERAFAGHLRRRLHSGHLHQPAYPSERRPGSGSTARSMAGPPGCRWDLPRGAYPPPSLLGGQPVIS